ncbi:2-keto-3-deoxygalactonate kinase [Hasllibacter halocynthiae]|uniref:2-keto-3-deoxygalactonate kinase n=1 Tax=Hasllibacter halocynthiae TaxID=595589 RepID=A0A2T0X6M9_9RHOB|nr:2-dehydro-3-deoxygalactonokinase [Hasllibacter halocynthiae]PRY94589.1 2-keto-3-deoxygalactonate kinase [Hasllibacter halocynthiae]
MTGWIAVDWGTSNLRAWGMEGDAPVWEVATAEGMSTLDPEGFEPALLAAVGDRLDGPTDVFACGMAGSRQGWAEAPYVPVPAPPGSGDAAVPPVSDPRLRVRILPGLSQADPPDVMRGEETQIAGLLAREPEFDGAVCLPGTHSKWAHVSAGEVVSFRTAMTGELFALLKSSTLRHSLGEWEEAPFLDAVSEAMSRPERIVTDLFRIRAAHLLDGDGTGTSRLSGLLVGAELAATRPWWLGRPVALIGAEKVRDAYAAALRAQGVPVMPHDAATATLRGLAAARTAMAG